MEDKRVPIDHVATIGRYEYEIYTRQEGDRTLVSSAITQRGFDALMNMGRDQRNKILDEQNKLVHEYMATISGVPPEPEPESKGMGHLSSPGRELARKIRGANFQALDDPC